MDVKVGISNVEGTNKVVVEQLDEGEVLPFQYEVDEEEFRKGYFIANLDRECSTQLTVISYNDNGFQRSNTITIPAIGYPQEELSFSFSPLFISISGLNENSLIGGEYSYSIIDIGSVFIPMPQRLNTSLVSLAKCKSGNHILTIYKKGEVIGTFKFQN